MEYLGHGRGSCSCSVSVRPLFCGRNRSPYRKRSERWPRRLADSLSKKSVRTASIPNMEQSLISHVKLQVHREISG